LNAARESQEGGGGGGPSPRRGSSPLLAPRKKERGEVVHYRVGGLNSFPHQHRGCNARGNRLMREEKGKKKERKSFTKSSLREKGKRFSDRNQVAVTKEKECLPLSRGDPCPSFFEREKGKTAEKVYERPRKSYEEGKKREKKRGELPAVR